MEVMVRRLWLAVLMMVGLSYGRAVPAAPAVRHTVTHAGLERSYHVVVPETAAPGAPMVLALHGAGGQGDRLDKSTGHRLSEAARARGWVLVMPDGVERGWNDGRPVVTRENGPRTAVDDTGFLNAVVDRLAADGTIDPDRVFVVGISNGGMMANRLAIEHSERFHTIAPMISNLSTSLGDVAPRAPVSVMMVNGTDDPVVPYDGGPVRVFGKTRGHVRSTEATIRWWADHNQCTGPPVTRALDDLDPSDGTRIFVQSLQACTDGSEVTLVKVLGGGHAWPGGPQYLPRRLVGRTSKDADAIAMVFAFFDRHDGQTAVPASESSGP